MQLVLPAVAILRLLLVTVCCMFVGGKYFTADVLLKLKMFCH